MNIFVVILNSILDFFKRILVRFKNAKFGIMFLVDIFKLPDFLFDSRASIISKFKVIGSFVITLMYFTSPYDIIPEAIAGGFGFIDDLVFLMWFIGIMCEEIGKYKRAKEGYKDPNIIDDVDFKIKDDD